jgi:hypothetical protein
MEGSGKTRYPLKFYSTYKILLCAIGVRLAEGSIKVPGKLQVIEDRRKTKNRAYARLAH